MRRFAIYAIICVTVTLVISLVSGASAIAASQSVGSAPPVTADRIKIRAVERDPNDAPPGRMDKKLSTVNIDEGRYNKKVHTTAAYYSNYWRHAPNIWKCTAGGEEDIIDNSINSAAIWEDPTPYYDRDSMTIRLRVDPGTGMLKLHKEGKQIVVIVEPHNADSINHDYPITYYWENNNIIVECRPMFRLESENPYTKVSGLQRYVPAVKAGYGWNNHSMYVGSESVGSIFCSTQPDAGQMSFTDIADGSGRLKAGKMIATKRLNGDGTFKEMVNTASEKLTIGGPGSFALPAAVGLWFQYNFDVHLYAPNPVDLTAKSLTPLASAEAGALVTTEFSINNDAHDTWIDEQADVLLEAESLEISETVSVVFDERGHGLATLTWNAPDGLTEEISVEVKATVNPDKSIDEPDYDNNSSTATILITPKEVRPTATPEPEPTPTAAPTPEPQTTATATPASTEPTSTPTPSSTPIPTPPQLADAAVLGITPSSKYAAGLSVITLVNIKNSGLKDISRDAPADVLFEIPSLGVAQTKQAEIASGQIVQIPFTWNAPAAIGKDVVIIVRANASRTIAESDYGNNEFTTTAQTYDVPPPPPNVEITPERKGTRDVNRTNNGVTRAESITYQMRLTITPNSGSATVKSGYGVECEVTTEVTTDNPDATMSGPQTVFAYFPLGYNLAVPLEAIRTSEDGYKTTWMLPKNPESPNNKRVYYIPVDWPDGKPFEIVVIAGSAATHLGNLSARTLVSYMVSGSMYDDDHTAEQ